MIFTVVFILSILVGPATTSADEPACAKPGPEVERLVSAVKRWIASGDAADRARRDSILPGTQVPDTAVVQENDEAVCRKLAAIYAALPGEVDVPAGLHVVRIGAALYAMFDPNDMSGSQRTVMMFDSGMALRGSWQDR